MCMNEPMNELFQQGDHCKTCLQNDPYYTGLNKIEEQKNSIFHSSDLYHFLVRQNLWFRFCLNHTGTDPRNTLRNTFLYKCHDTPKQSTSPPFSANLCTHHVTLSTNHKPHPNTHTHTHIHTHTHTRLTALFPGLPR